MWDCIRSQSFKRKAHRFTAMLMLRSKLPLCTVKSINPTTSSFNASTVSSRRGRHRVSALCISVKRVLTRSLNIWWQTYFPNARISHPHQGETSSALWNVSPPHQTCCRLGFHNPPHRSLRYGGIGRISWRRQWQGLEIDALKSLTNVHDNVPFLSGQMSWKYLRSSSGRWLSIGTQYLKRSLLAAATIKPRERKPNRVQSAL